jgi:hypothetical protein
LWKINGHLKNFHENPRGIRWSAENQSKSKSKTRPCSVRGEPGWKERKEICQNLKLTEWKPKEKNEQGNWQLLNLELSITLCDIEETGEETDDDDSS